MKRSSQSRAKDLPSQLFASNPAMLIGAAFEIGMLLGRRSGRTAMGRKLRESVNSVADQAVRLAPDAVVKLVPALAPAKPRPRRRTAKKSQP
ncbi:MAG TPA: hypothetical protein VFK79_11425 [Xanthobacteraceae bacterium]|nr:hypothetical protein [Xanthobacteraceae bacterium]